MFDIGCKVPVLKRFSARRILDESPPGSGGKPYTPTLTTGVNTNENDEAAMP